MLFDCLINGEISNVVPVTDRGLQYGHGVFETLAVDRGTPVMWAEHLLRLRRGCERLGLAAPEEAVLLREIQTVCSGRQRALVKVMVTAGEGSRGYQLPANPVPNRIVAAFAFPEDCTAARNTGVKLRVCEQRMGLNRPLAAIKHMNRLEQVLARAEWDDPAVADGLMLDQEDFVISVTCANLFLVSDGLLLTPRLDRCGIRGVVRDGILSQFASSSEKRRITTEFLHEAEEVFICNSIRGVWPVTDIAGREYHIGPRTREVQDWLAGLSPLLART
jgi:4-amino-4-deoxychorismate lyase